ncbi:putative outer membrane lipoprotein [Candidatus Terasakiella magnetica]|uniref:Putative outer membrane lipoprotein n=1 Tax=Candidatus Terasakiella magnetica TaxID=1867952 RepID=A0A1C3RCX2_9PROT|nr:outer membrane protein assembly factor BamE [Candidatus Terasakiella magnetica]SCA55129.1 putative outer membrane lipoprotein [Candidatus Terasakiella magnetica]
MLKMVRSKTVFGVGLLMGAALMLSACTSQFATRGNLPSEERMAEIIPGEIHARDVAEILGTPSTFSTFGGESWYYISERVEYYAFMEPEILDRKVIQVKFTKEGMVEWVEKKDNQQGRKIQFVERVTATAGNEITFFEQVFGNLGRFNK